MIEKVGGFPDHEISILGDRGDRGLDRLLTKLLGAVDDAAIEQLAGVGDVGARLGAVLHAFLKVMDGKRRHGRSLSPLLEKFSINSQKMPAAAPPWRRWSGLPIYPVHHTG